ncbi:Acyltransferase family protein [Microbacterium hydrocarbonoxydans]|uniref:Acyltransferase family protein n=1 Tax=Microbacterium hydrocarbonoxydans TaxID=273678 RepID=A0A0M2HHH2_9MICO|nr:acyltransferase [Microbacterium hydrocarbonoxydans]KJL46190.1 Acyltransferase family protein [Microbacterium hydrocarbonoxydans]
MTDLQAPPTRVPAAHPTPARDTGVDLVRAACVSGVVLLHAIMVGVTVTDAGPVFTNASEGAWWIAPVSWLLQVMPLFFVIGGFAGVVAYRRQRERGGTATGFVSARIHRLLRPAVVAVGIAGAGLLILLLVGLPGELVAIAGFRYAQPLWFLGVFLLCQALLPALSALHDRAPRRTLALLAASAVIVDIVRAASGIDGIGFVNLAFVWLTLQQLGFFFADGAVDALSRQTRAAMAAAATATLVVAFATGVYSPDLIANINPPTGALLLVGVVHLSLLSLFRERIARFSTRPRVAAVSAFVNRRTMTIYLWHMPVLLAMAGSSSILALAHAIVLPTPGSGLWWLGRPLWLVTALALTAAVAIALSRFEEKAAPARTTGIRRSTAAAGVGISAVALLLVVGATPLTATAAVAMMLVSLRLVSPDQTAPRAASASATSSAWRSVRTMSGTTPWSPERAAPRAR